MEKLSRRGLLARQRGSVTVEFAFTVIVFLMLVLFVAEISRLAYVSSIIDLAVSEAAKEAKNSSSSQSGDYRSRFEQRLFQRGGSLWTFLTRADAVTINIAYAASINEMINHGGSTADHHFRPLARYQLQYRYHPMFFFLPDVWANNFLNREVIFVQEYERSKFMH
ncbi:pilus assembly protein TadE [Mixta theicola]|uniref:Pilus assembly protein TadE n=2 Tax=Mixta theicola TaxID=1458355 RepID=A0A2K1QA89_9GAMM|nr:pilus assembly protein TadE [Mixta theicola]